MALLYYALQWLEFYAQTALLLSAHFKCYITFRILFLRKDAGSPRISPQHSPSPGLLLDFSQLPLLSLLNSHSCVQRHLLPLPGDTAEFTCWLIIFCVLDQHAWHLAQDLTTDAQCCWLRDPSVLGESSKNLSRVSSCLAGIYSLLGTQVSDTPAHLTSFCSGFYNTLCLLGTV